MRPFLDTEPFFVQTKPRGVWHVESGDDCELMLCGLRISVDDPYSKVQNHWGTKPCLWCKRELERLSSRRP